MHKTKAWDVNKYELVSYKKIKKINIYIYILFKNLTNRLACWSLTTVSESTRTFIINYSLKFN
jgi:hypothetical protein